MNLYSQILSLPFLIALILGSTIQLAPPLLAKELHRSTQNKGKFLCRWQPLKGADIYFGVLKNNGKKLYFRTKSNFIRCHKKSIIKVEGYKKGYGMLLYPHPKIKKTPIRLRNRVLRRITKRSNEDVVFFADSEDDEIYNVDIPEDKEEKKEDFWDLVALKNWKKRWDKKNLTHTPAVYQFFADLYIGSENLEAEGGVSDFSGDSSNTIGGTTISALFKKSNDSNLSLFISAGGHNYKTTIKEAPTSQTPNTQEREKKYLRLKVFASLLYNMQNIWKLGHNKRLHLGGGLEMVQIPLLQIQPDLTAETQLKNRKAYAPYISMQFKSLLTKKQNINITSALLPLTFGNLGLGKVKGYGVRANSYWQLSYFDPINIRLGINASYDNFEKKIECNGYSNCDDKSKTESTQISFSLGVYSSLPN